MRKQKIRKRTRTRMRKRKRRVVGEVSLIGKMRVVRGKHLVRNLGGTIFGFCGIKLSRLIDTPLNRGGSGERNSNQVVFLYLLFE